MHCRPCSEIQPWNGNETLLPSLALCCSFCSTVRRASASIHVDCVKVFPVLIVELSQGCVSGSDSVGGEGYSANVFVRSPFTVSKHCHYRSGILCNGRSVVGPTYLAYQFSCHLLLIKFLWRETGFQCHGSSQSLKGQVPSRRVLGKDLFVNL
jgi:hypothetical protein